MRRKNDLYPTEQKITERLLREIPDIGGEICEPCCGPMLMANKLQEHGNVITADIDPDFNPSIVCDSADGNSAIWASFINDRYIIPKMYDWVITNPPFSSALEILLNSWFHSRVGVAFLLRLSFLEPSGERSGNRGAILDELSDHMSNLIIFGDPRPSYTGNGKTDSVTTAWMVWRHDFSWSKLGLQCPFVFAHGWKNEP